MSKILCASNTSNLQHYAPPSRTRPMRTSSTLTLRPAFFLSLFTASLWLSPSSRAAAMLTVSPASISNTYTGSVTLQISGLTTNGETVLIERFLDADSNGTNDAGELLVQSFNVTDGQVTAFGGVRDTNIPGDVDGVAGQISTAFYFSASPEFGRVAGDYVFRLSSPTGRFTPVVQSLSVTPAAFSQFITGRITHGGTNVPDATAALLVQTGQDVQFVAGAAGTTNGDYTITAAPGTYHVLAAKPGF